MTGVQTCALPICLEVEEVFIHAIANRGYQQRVISIFKSKVPDLEVHPWEGPEAEKVVPHHVLMKFLKTADDVERLSMAEAGLRAGDASLLARYQPRCCSSHAGVRTLAELLECENQNSVNRNFGEMYTIDLGDYMIG